MKAEGILSSKSVSMGDRQRIYYSITPQGGTSVNAALEELKNFVDLLQRVITPVPHPLP